MSSGPAYDLKEQVRQATDIVDLIGSYLMLRPQGRNYVALCPWHNDRRPSLQVNPERQSWKCWVCNIGGDVFSFIMQQESVEFREALEMLAERAHIALVPRSSGSAKSSEANEKQPLYDALAWAERQWHEFLLRADDAEPARRYLEERGVERESIERFRLGYAPPGWQWLIDRAKTTPHSAAVLEAAGLVGRGEQSGSLYDRFRGRLMFPIRDMQRRPIAFGGRVLPELAQEEEERKGRPPAKYVNSNETRLFKKSQHFYGLDLARDVLTKTRHVTIVEGYTDVVLTVQAGLDDVIAVLGTALGTDHIRVLRRLADRITLVLDGDTAGQKRANEILDLFVAEGVDLRIATLPAGLDPCDYVQQFGGQSLRDLVDRAPDALEHKFMVATEGIDPATDTHRAHQALEDVLATLSRLPRRVGEAASLRLREQQVLLRLARRFQVDAAQLQERLKELKRKSGRTAPSEESAPRREDTHSVEEELLEILIAHPEMASEVLDRVASEQLAPGSPRQLYEAYCRLHDAGQPIEFGRVMVELEDPQLKSLLVDLDERSRDKAQLALQAVEARIESVRTLLRERRTAEEQRRRVAALEEAASGGDDEDNLEILRQLIEQERNRQGIVAPTDG